MPPNGGDAPYRSKTKSVESFQWSASLDVIDAHIYSFMACASDFPLAQPVNTITYRARKGLSKPFSPIRQEVPCLKPECAERYMPRRNYGCRALFLESLRLIFHFCR